MNITFRINQNGNHFRWNAETEFRSMRTFLLQSSTKLDKVFICRLVDVIDFFKDMKPGDEKFIVCSHYEALVGRTLEELNKKVELYNRLIEEGTISKNYAPSISGFVIKRTAKCYTYTSLETA